ncbi:MurR/RpiR family transcriptional regulator [Sphaerochaeta sp. PS]|uniref:MurR/RpiR family transcriptional regulator n=1 Tax=Sphaerochaeta sp. PS TaxID=3076336 RepID=UPI0028A44C14|nr:MurR/RpiR family transcriptional regulator [Sphaerochaeta sp. PS]MDT4762142.1 MurR/RpiR family transcriptional regulator [Sphaerochaeta sp. PS]
MEGCTTLLQQALSYLSPSEAKVATYLLEHPTLAVKQSITTLAKESGSSTAAVVRLCKRLQFEGYGSLKLALAQEVYGNSAPRNEGPYIFDLSKAEGVGSIATMMVDTVCESITSLKGVLSSGQLEIAVELLLTRKKILLAGIGASALAAMDLYQKLGRLGMYASFPSEPDLQIVNACALDEQSVAVIFSYSGETKTMRQVAQQAKRAGATVVAVTRVGGNSLSKIADVVLTVPDSEALYRQGATLSRLNQLVVVDILYSSLIASRPDAELLLTTTWKAVSHASGLADQKKQ